MSAQSPAAIVTDTAHQAEGIAIVLAGREAAPRSHLKQLLDKERDMNVIAQTSHLDSVRQHVHEHHPDVVVLGFNTHRLPALAALDALFREAEGPRYVVMNIEQDAEQDALPDAIRLATSCELARTRSC